MQSALQIESLHFCPDCNDRAKHRLQSQLSKKDKGQRIFGEILRNHSSEINIAPHAIKRMKERVVTKKDLSNLKNGQVVEFFKFGGEYILTVLIRNEFGRNIHVQFSYLQMVGKVTITTIYIPEAREGEWDKNAELRLCVCKKDKYGDSQEEYAFSSKRR
jgi:hypothetical protein